MWYLTSDSDKRVIYVLPDNNITIGRSVDAQNCNFAVPNDPSISRKHATILISEDALYLKDLGSKYGTFVNDSDKIEQDKMIKLNAGDVVKFGKMGSVWKAQVVNFITCTSTLKGESLLSLKNLLTKLNGTLKNEWDDTCAYLTMPAITLTIKVVLALVQSSYIVTVNYWSKCLESITNNNALPNPNEFTPDILESTLNKENVSFLPSKERSSIFSGKKIIFFSRRQLEMYRMVLLKSSAIVLLLSDSKLTKSALCDENVIVVQYNVSSVSQETQAQKDQITEIANYLKSKGKRIVADAEIGLAILYCSTAKYCNPEFNFSSEIIKQVPNENAIANVLAQESQEPSHSTLKKESVCIDESLTPKQNPTNISNEDSAHALKRKLSEDDINNINSVNKKQATESTSTQENNTNKRSGEDINNLSSIPPKRVANNIDDDDEVFKFLKPAETKKTIQENQNKKLNLSKPLKRKHSTEMEEDDLFNFVDNGNKKPALDKGSSNSIEEIDEVENVCPINKPRGVIEDKIDVQALRGSKLEELMKMNASIPYNNNIKKEVSELDIKFSNIDLGSTTVVVKADLVIKREPLQVLLPQTGIKNFKKFKKVWPIKMQVSVSKSSFAVSDIDSNVGAEIPVDA